MNLNCFSLIGWDEYLMGQGIIMSEKIKTYTGSNINKFRYSAVLNPTTSSSPVRLYKSSSLKYRRKVEDLPPIASRSTEKPKAVLIYRNGDVHFQGLQVTVTPKRFRNFDNLLTELTRITNLPQGARYIFTPTGGTRVESLDQLHNGGSYVCDSRPKLKKIDYTKIRTRSKTVGNPTKLSNSFSNMYNTNFQSTCEEHVDIVKAKIITAVRNGITRPHVKVKLVLNKRTAHTLVQVLDDLTSAISADGCIRKLYTLEGKRIQKLAELFNEHSVFIAVGTERFRSCDIPIIKDELGMNTEYSTYKPNHRASGGSLPRKSYSLRCRPTRPKPKLQNNGYEFSLLKIGKIPHPPIPRRNSDGNDTLKALDDLPIVKQYEDESRVYLNEEEEQFLNNIPYLNDNIYIQNQHRSKVDRNIFDKSSMNTYNTLPPIIRNDIVTDVKSEVENSSFTSRKEKKRRELSIQNDDEQMLNDQYFNSPLNDAKMKSAKNCNIETIQFMASSGNKMNSNGVVTNGNSQNDLENNELGNYVNSEHSDNGHSNRIHSNNDSQNVNDVLHNGLLKTVEEKAINGGLYIDTASHNGNLKTIIMNSNNSENGVQIEDNSNYEENDNKAIDLVDELFKEEKEQKNKIEVGKKEAYQNDEHKSKAVENIDIELNNLISETIKNTNDFDGYESGDGNTDSSSNDSGIENTNNDDAEDSQGSFIKFEREGSTGESELPFDDTEHSNEISLEDNVMNSSEDAEEIDDCLVKENDDDQEEEEIYESEISEAVIEKDDHVEIENDANQNKNEEEEGRRVESGYDSDKNLNDTEFKEKAEKEENREDDEEIESTDEETEGTDEGLERTDEEKEATDSEDETSSEEEDTKLKERAIRKENISDGQVEMIDSSEEENNVIEDVDNSSCEIENKDIKQNDIETGSKTNTSGDTMNEGKVDDSTDEESYIQPCEVANNLNGKVESRKGSETDEEKEVSQSEESSSDSDEDIVTFLNKLKREGEIPVTIENIEKERNSSYNGEIETNGTKDVDIENTDASATKGKSNASNQIAENGIKSSHPLIDVNEQISNGMNSKSTTTMSDEGRTGGPIDKEEDGRCESQGKKNNPQNNVLNQENNINKSNESGVENVEVNSGIKNDVDDDDVFIDKEKEAKMSMNPRERFLRENMTQIESPFKLAADNKQGNEKFTNDGIRAFYDIGDILGDGNFAVVREARDKKTKKHYALKIIDASKIEGKEVLLQNEITIQRECNHPNLVKLYHDFHSPTDIFLVMELVPDGDFFDYISDNVKLDEEEASMYIRDMCSGIDYLHEKSVVHRDIKPENLLLCATSNGEAMLKITDFGLAQRITSPLYTVCGTPTYVAPEILTEEGYGIEVDIWAAGVILYIMLCGFPPFRSNKRGTTELFDIIEAGVFEFLPPYWDSISELSKDLIRGMLLVDVKKRFTAKDILNHKWFERYGLRRTSICSEEHERSETFKTVGKGKLAIEKVTELLNSKTEWNEK